MLNLEVIIFVDSMSELDEATQKADELRSKYFGTVFTVKIIVKKRA